MRRLSSLMCLAAAISIAAAVLTGPAAADQPACQSGSGPPGPDPSAPGGVNIHITKTGSVIWCSAQVIIANKDVVDGTNYPVQATPQSPSSNPVSNALSVSGLLTLAGLNPVGVDHLEIMRLNGSWSTLTNADLVNPSASFQDGLKPIVWINGSETQYLRPLRGPTDANGDDQIVASNGDALDLYVYSGPVLNVSATATPSQVAPNQPVTLTAHVTNAAPADGPLTYTWTFQDGATAIGQTVTHAYNVAGQWRPVVTVQGRSDDSGGSTQILVTVGSVPKSGSGAFGGGTNHDKHARAGGPSRSGGNTPNTSPTNNKSGGAGANTTTTTTTSTTTATTPTTTTTTTTTTSAPATSVHSVRPVHRAAAVHRRRTASHGTARAASGETTVTGRLIADVTPVSPAQLERAGKDPQPTPANAPSAAAGGGAITPLGGIAGGSVIVALLGSGAWFELRSRRRAVMPGRPA